MRENRDAFKVYCEVYDQHIMGFGGPVALNNLALFEWVDRLIPDKRKRVRVAKQVNAVYRSILADKQFEEKAMKGK